MKIAIVGTGVSGLVVAHHLHRDHEVTVYEADERIGGHTHTIEVDVPEGRVQVDTGFIVCNERTYPNFLALLDQLQVPTQPSEMSFSVSDPSAGIEYRASNPSTLFAQRRNLLRPGFGRMAVDLVRFSRAVGRVARSELDDPDVTLADFVRTERYSPEFVRWFLVPFGASIWSADPAAFLDFPLATYARFVANHGMIDARNRPRWRTVTGGSSAYVRALTAPFAHRIRHGTAVHKVRRDDASSTVEVLTDGGTEVYDRVVLATHSDQALRLLPDASRAEQEILSAIRYQPNLATLHTDQRLLPVNRRARASWNFHVGAAPHAATVTYWMNRLQSLPTSTPLMVSLNSLDRIDPAAVLRTIHYEHPVFDSAAIRAQRRRADIQGARGTYFAGAYWGYGFHEDGVNSALDVVSSLRAR